MSSEFSIGTVWRAAKIKLEKNAPENPIRRRRRKKITKKH